MSYELRSITADEVRVFRTVLGIAFGRDLREEGDARFNRIMPLDRTVATFDGDTLVATLGDFPLELAVPGGMQLATAGTTMVTVLPTHTRRGILRSMIREHLDKALERSEPLAALWASEPAIYGRFGFGLATEMDSVQVDARQLSPFETSSDVQMDWVSSAEIMGVVAPYWREVAGVQSGFIDRVDARWQDFVAEPEWMAEGASASRHVIARRAGRTVGHLQYRQKGDWLVGGGPNGTVAIESLVASDLNARLALWKYATSVDLFPNVTYAQCAIDDPLAYAVAESRAVRRLRTDALYVRILDVPTALAARTYEADGELVMAVADSLGYAEGNFRLTVAGGQAHVDQVDEPADVSLDVRELGALYLGRMCCDLNTRLGLITGDPAGIRRLGQLFMTSRAPWCSEEF